MKKNVLFVGSFKKELKDGSTGGVLFATSSLANSKLNKIFNFILIDSTDLSVPPPSFIRKLPRVITRFLNFTYALFFRKIQTVLIFSSSGLSLLEKGTMALISKIILNKRVVFAPRAGDMAILYNNHILYKFFLPIVINNSDVVICQSAYWANFYKSVCKNKNTKFEIIYNWINLPTEIKEVKKPRSNDKLIVLYIAWIEETKGIFELVKASQILHSKRQDIEYWIYGGGKNLDDIKYLVEKNNLQDFFFLKGWANSQTKKESYAKADLFVLPTHFEGFPNSMLEAMSNKVPVLISNLDCLEGYIIDNYNACLFETKNSYDLSNKIEMLLDNPNLRKSLSSNAYNTVLKENNIERSIEKIKPFL